LICFGLWISNLDSFYSSISETIFKKNELDDIAKQIAIPFAFIGISFSQFKYILQPDTDLKEFYNWDDYIKLKDTYITGLIWNAIPVVITLILIFIFPNIGHKTKGFLYVSTILASAFSTVTIIFARQKLKEIIEKNKKENKPSH